MPNVSFSLASKEFRVEMNWRVGVRTFRAVLAIGAPEIQRIGFRRVEAQQREIPAPNTTKTEQKATTVPTESFRSGCRVINEAVRDGCCLDGTNIGGPRHTQIEGSIVCTRHGIDHLGASALTTSIPKSQKQTCSLLNIEVTNRALLQSYAIQQQYLLIRMNALLYLYLFLEIEKRVEMRVNQQGNLATRENLYLDLKEKHV
jgi:hypothetical protein